MPAAAGGDDGSEDGGLDRGMSGAPGAHVPMHAFSAQGSVRVDADAPACGIMGGGFGGRARPVTGRRGSRAGTRAETKVEGNAVAKTRAKAVTKTKAKAVTKTGAKAVTNAAKATRPKSPRLASILADDEVRIVAGMFRKTIRETLGEDAFSKFGDVEAADFVRWASLRHTCQEAREELGLTIRDAALALKIPQQRLRAIEDGDNLDFEPPAAWRYFEFLGIQAWVKRWTAANHALAERAGLVAMKGPARESGPGRAAQRQAGSHAKAARAASKGSRLPANDVVYQFKVTLKYVRPPIWRRIVVPGSYSFWDLHVAVQDAMGWLDGHLHVFRARHPGTGSTHEIGSPDLDDRRGAMLTEWKVAIADYFIEPGDQVEYDYDFGDGWQHAIVLEKISARAPQVTYPLCLKGARACPPEDCGGIAGYSDLLRKLHGSSARERAEIREWLGRDYDPAAFDPREVCFDEPKERLRTKIT